MHHLSFTLLILFLLVSNTFGKRNLSILKKLRKPTNNPYQFPFQDILFAEFNVERALSNKGKTCSSKKCIFQELDQKNTSSCTCFGELPADNFEFTSNTSLRVNYTINEQELKTVMFIFECNNLTNFNVSIASIAEYIVYFNTSVLCDYPHKQILSWGWISIIIFGVVIITYIVIGSIINAFLRNKHGFEVFPQAYFWISLPGLVFYGMKTVLCSCCMCSCRAKQKASGYVDI